jgi:hypothetical protein
MRRAHGFTNILNWMTRKGRKPPKARMRVLTGSIYGAGSPEASPPEMPRQGQPESSSGRKPGVAPQQKNKPR